MLYIFEERELKLISRRLYPVHSYFAMFGSLPARKYIFLIFCFVSSRT